MLFENIEAIQTNASKIARMKMRVGQGGTELSRVTEQFNEMFGGDSNEVAWHWFFPLPVEFPQGMQKVVLGFEWDSTFDAVPYQEPGDEEMGDGSSQGGRIELTTTPSSSASSQKEKSSEHETPDIVDVSGGGEEGDFTGTPVTTSDGAAKLVKRGNSRDRSVGSDLSRQGTLT